MSEKQLQKKQPAFLSYEHKSLQEFGASKFVTKRLEIAENMKVSLDLYNNQINQHAKQIFVLYFSRKLISFFSLVEQIITKVYVDKIDLQTLLKY